MTPQELGREMAVQLLLARAIAFIAAGSGNVPKWIDGERKALQEILVKSVSVGTTPADNEVANEVKTTMSAAMNEILDIALRHSGDLPDGATSLSRTETRV
jgi:hypothetical protein